MDEQDILAALNNLARVISAHVTMLNIQLVDAQAQIAVLLDLEQKRMVKDGQSQQDAAQSVQALSEAHRTRLLKVAEERLSLAGLAADFGSIQ